MLSRKFFAAITLLVSFLMPLCGQAAPLYTVHVIDADFRPVAINNLGQIAGNVVVDGIRYAALYSNGVLTNLGTLDRGNSYAFALNDAGSVAGWDNGHAFLYRDGTMRDLGNNMVAYGINTGGDVVGLRLRDDLHTVGFLYRNDTVTELGYLGTATYSYAADINDAGDIAGISAVGQGESFHPFLLRNGVMTDLGILGSGEYNGAAAINNAGQVAGYSVGPEGILHAFRYEEGVMTDLGAFGDRATYVQAMNEQGVVLIGSGPPNGSGYTGTAFISVGNALVELDTLIDQAAGWSIYDVGGINDLGQIVAMGCRVNACVPIRLDLASAVPEPSAALLLVTGLLTLMWTRRRHYRVARQANVPARAS